jgi:fatty acid desaturase
MPQPPVSRRDLRRALALNALIHPVPGLVAAGVLVAAVLLGAAWLALVAVACWLVLATMTFFDEREAEKVGERARARRRSA